jgi:hypothetical protein
MLPKLTEIAGTAAPERVDGISMGIQSPRQVGVTEGQVGSDRRAAFN